MSKSSETLDAVIGDINDAKLGLDVIGLRVRREIIKEIQEFLVKCNLHCGRAHLSLQWRYAKHIFLPGTQGTRVP